MVGSVCITRHGRMDKKGDLIDICDRGTVQKEHTQKLGLISIGRSSTNSLVLSRVNLHEVVTVGATCGIIQLHVQYLQADSVTAALCVLIGHVATSHGARFVATSWHFQDSQTGTLNSTSTPKFALVALKASRGIIHCCPASPFAMAAFRPFATTLLTPFLRLCTMRDAYHGKLELQHIVLHIPANRIAEKAMQLVVLQRKRISSNEFRYSVVVTK
jgi:hypothetical protein